MRNVLLILKREYISRVSKRSFIIMTLLGPLLIGIVYSAIIWLAVSEMGESKKQLIAVSDQSGYIGSNLKTKDSSRFDFMYSSESYGSLKNRLEQEDIDGILIIPAFKLHENPDSIRLITRNSASISDKARLTSAIEDRLFEVKLSEKGISRKSIDSLKTDISLSNPLLKQDKLEDSGTEAKAGIGYFAAFIIYIFIFIFGVQVMRGVTEEKTNRIIEIMVSSVKPFHMMLGKIFGIALVGLTQFIVWIGLSAVIIMVATALVGQGMASGAQEVAYTTASPATQIAANNNMADLLHQFTVLPVAKILVGFLFFFLGGFLLYSSLFAAIGSAVDNDTETQQFMMPITIPLVFALIIAQMAVFKDPNGGLAYWTSIIPFTSPIVMMVRIPFDISWGEMLLSMFILTVTFVVIVWLASKIYRIGILMYGKKASYKELIRWMLSKD